MCVYVCVCERERERERDRVKERERDRHTQSETRCVAHSHSTHPYQRTAPSPIREWRKKVVIFRTEPSLPARVAGKEVSNP